MVKPLAETFHLAEPPAGFTRAPECPPVDEGWSRKMTDRLYEGPTVAILTAVDQEGGIAPIPLEEFYKPPEDSRPVEWRDVQARRGVIDLLYTAIETQPHIVAKILGAGVVVRAEAHFTERAIRYEIMSPLLPPVPVGEISPRYAAYFDGIDECVRFASI